jgi:hypothetical protein
MFEDGFFDRRKLQESVIAYAREMGMLVKRKPPKLKQKEVFAQIRALGLTVKRDEAGEFRVTVKGVPAKRAEELAYYTNDLQDLLSTAHAIIRHEDQLDSNRMDNPGELPSMQEQVDKANAKWQTPVALNGYDGVPVGVGDRVELHPATDLWMRGAKFGRVVRLNAGPPMSLSVKMDHPKIKRAVRFDPVNVRRIT